MHFQLADGLTVFLPVILPTKETSILWPSLKLIYVLEVISIVAMCPGTALLVYALGKSVRLFHRNLIKIAQVHLAALTLSQISRIFILCFEVGILQMKGSFDERLYVLVFLRYLLLCYLMTIIPAVIAERALASHYISDYEFVKRRWISLLINSSAFLISGFYNVLMQLIAFGLYSMLFLLIFALLLFTSSFTSIMMVYRRDAAMLRDLSNETGHSVLNYTLSIKFQLAENVRVAKLLTYAALSLCMWATGISCVCSPAYLIFTEEQPVSQILYAVTNVIIALSLTITVWLPLLASEKLKPTYKRLNKYFCCMTQKVQEIMVHPAASSVVDTEGKMDKHFVQLRTAWKTIP